MAKVHRDHVPLDDAVAEFIHRRGQKGDALNYITGWRFGRSVNGITEVQITMISDDELQMFGQKVKEEPTDG